MIAFSEILKSFSPLKSITSKNSPLRKHILGKITDLFLIVISIYLALNFEGWAEKRNEHKKLIQYYENFIGEIEKDTVALSEVITDTEILLKNTGSHIRLLRNYKSTLQDTVTRLFTGMLSGQLFYSSQMISYKAMVLSGDIKLIKNIAMREKLIELEEEYNGLKLYEDMYLEYFKGDLLHSFSNNFDLLDQKLTNKDYYSQQQHRNLVAGFYSLNDNRLAQYKKALLKARETLDVIARELDK